MPLFRSTYIPLPQPNTLRIASNTFVPIMENSAFLGSGILRPKDRAHDRTYLLARFDRDERKLIKRIVVKHHGDNLAAQNKTWTNLMPESKRKAINDLHQELVSLKTYQERVLQAWDNEGKGGMQEQWFAEKFMHHCHNAPNKPQRQGTSEARFRGDHEVVGDSSNGRSKGPGRGACEELEHGASGGVDTAKLC
ncbi:hypothetical protein C7212DRAFT_341583 [Tuber magnatum]|uniref:Uncharacterized protein n=1 Tax=Tuber magnatum TaxID=42249 RepID=A0A317SWX6_9PEZI|nr:hypothetical protein C7212DRAFT_341582 [Tuber magnatum]PWW78973.1 hypothetical protein C7212DRAFT_341583 [Tuber magnatum]